MYTTWHPEELPATKSYTNSLGKICLIRTMIDGDYRITTGTIDGLVEALADLNTPGTTTRAGPPQFSPAGAVADNTLAFVRYAHQTRPSSTTF